MYHRSPDSNSYSSSHKTHAFWSALMLATILMMSCQTPVWSWLLDMPVFCEVSTTERDADSEEDSEHLRNIAEFIRLRMATYWMVQDASKRAMLGQHSCWYWDNHVPELSTPPPESTLA